MTAGDPRSRIPAYPGVERFVDALDRLVVQPRRNRGRVPVVLLTEGDGGHAGRQIVAGLRSRLRGRSEVLAPHAYVPEIPDGAPPLELFEQIATQLAQTMPPGTGQLRLPGYRLLHSVATVAAIGGTFEHRHRELRDHCYTDHRGWSRVDELLWWVGGHDQAGAGGTFELLWHFLAGPLFQKVPRWRFGVRASRRMLGGRRNPRWYAEWIRQQHGTPPTDFFRSALDLAPGGEARDPEQLDRVLMHALLADLDGAVRARLFRPWRRRRITRFVLLFEEAGPWDSRTQRFLRELRSAIEDLDCSSVLAVSAGARSLANRVPDFEASDLTHAGDRLALVEQWAARVPAGEPNGIVVPVREGPADNERAAYWLGLHPMLVVPSRRLGPGTETVAACTALVVALAATIVVLTGNSPTADSCAGGTFLGQGGHCVGVTEGKARFAKGPNEKQVGAVLDQIDQQNNVVYAAMKNLAPGRPHYRTVVYLGPLTGGNGDEDPVRGGTLPELRGIALAQQSINDLALNGGERVPLRILVANAGDLFADAPKVADSIVKLAGRDRSIVGVVGFGQSRLATYQAMRTLDAAGIPMVGTSGTADQLLQQGPHYYQTAPTDERAAKIMAAFVEHAAMVRQADGHDKQATRVELFADPTDPYSNSLATSFRTEYPAARTDVLLLSGSGTADVPGALAGTRYDTLAGVAQQVCDATAGSKQPVALVWAGRASQFMTFLDEYRMRSDACPRLSVLGGDDITNALLLGSPWSAFSALTLYHVSLGQAPVLNGADAEARTYLTAYDARYGSDTSAFGRAMRQDGHPALAWDALRYLSKALDEAWSSTGKVDDRLDRTLVQAVLYQGLGGGGFNGATGHIDSHGANGGGRMTTDKLVSVLRAVPDGAPQTVLLCGAVTAADVRQTWGKDYPCQPAAAH
ncbi:type 1 periplasmic-binding domain-containing protein [Actinacidiphila oryziradicis]|nr:ABC transporter substrate-binding protein [Actinacidiphila oryziradicis]